MAKMTHTGLILWMLVAHTLLAETNAFSVNEVMKGDTTTLYTGNAFSFERYWIELYARDYFVFSVRACGDVHLALAELRTSQGVNVTELVLGGWYNTKSVIRNGVDGREHYLDVETPQLMHCTDFRTFWVEWGNRMRVGIGPIPGEQVFMDLENSRHWVSAIGFSTGYGNTGVWKIPENQGHYMIAYTPDDFRYEYLWKTTDYMNNHFLFRVAGCSDVHINLTPTMGTRYYEVVLGGWNNTKSVIRYGDVHQAEYLETGIISCNELRFFWIEWEAGLIRVGKGETVRRNQILNATDPGYVGINHLSVCSGFGHTATWVLSENLENTFRFHGHSGVSTLPVYNTYITTSRQSSVVFEVTGCSNVWVQLVGYRGYVEMGDFNIYIGTENNTRVGVMDNWFTPIKEVPMSNVLNCLNPTWLWVRWSGESAHLGRGNLVGQWEILTWNSSAVTRVNNVAFSSTDPAGAYFLVRKNTGDSVYTYTQGNLDRRQMWVSVRQQLVFRFQVQACHSAHVSLTGFTGVNDEQTYEIVLGSCYRTIVWDHIQGTPNEIAVSNSSDVMSCTEFISFWISWVDGYVRIGHGFRYGRRQILQLAQRKPHPINAVNIDTMNTFGAWEVESDNGDFWIMTSLFNNNVIKWFHLHRWTHWFHFQVSGNAAHLILASRYQDPLDVYNIYIGASQNTEVALWKDSNLLSRVNKPNVIHSSHMRNFWVSWEGGQIKVGATKFRDRDILIDYKDSKPLQITSMGLTGDRGDFAEWRIWETIAVEMSYTSSSFVYFDQAWWSVRHRTATLFALRTCGRAEIVLSAIMHEYYNSKHAYTIVLDNTSGTTSLWRGSRNNKLAEAATPDVLSCTTEKFYWLSWYEGHIALGEGMIKGKQILLSFQDMEALSVEAISFSTFEAEGYWRVPMTWDEFQIVPPRKDPNALGAGEIVGIVIGGLLVLAVFVFLLMKILAPSTTDSLVSRARNGLGGFGSSSSSEAATTRAPTSFENPIAMHPDAFAEVHIS